jgi:hypothetical protein
MPVREIIEISVYAIDLEDAKDQIAKALDPKFALPAPTTASLNPFGRGGDELLEWLESLDPSDPNTPLICWPDTQCAARATHR